MSTWFLEVSVSLHVHTAEHRLSEQTYTRQRVSTVPTIALSSTSPVESGD